MRKLIMTGIALLTLAISSCDEETAQLGDSLTSNIDQFSVFTQAFNVDTKSLKTDSVLASSNYQYLGKIKDPETGSYITCDYMTQFTLLERETSSLFPDADKIVSRDANNLPQADSCQINIMINAYQGDSLTAMKLTVYEMDKPVKNSTKYYTDFDPKDKGYVRTTSGAVQQNKVYSISDLTLSDSLRNVFRKSAYYEYIRVPINKPYTDKSDASATYNNYGTYLMQKYYSDPSSFKNANTFIRNICPGFYIKNADGQGVMIEVAYTQLVVFFTYQVNGKEYHSSKAFNSTEEVLQTTHITNDKKSIEDLVTNHNGCTFVKSPAGIFTEVTLPITKIKETDDKGVSHVNDTITSAKIAFQRIKNTSELSEYVLAEPDYLLLIPRDSLYTFFEHNGLPDNKLSYTASYNSTQKTYTFNNITNLINHMYANRNKSENWNKAVLVPVQVTTTSSSGSSTSSIAHVANEMSISSVRLVGGSANQHAPVTISIIYNRSK